MRLRDVHVIGTGLTAFGRFPEKSLADIGWPAVKEALVEASISPKSIGAVYCGTALGGMLAGQRVMKSLCLTGMTIVNIENACSSSSSALSMGWLSVASRKRAKQCSSRDRRREVDEVRQRNAAP